MKRPKNCLREHKHRVIVADDLQPGVIPPIDAGRHVRSVAWNCFFGKTDPKISVARKLFVVLYLNTGQRFSHSSLISLAAILAYSQVQQIPRHVDDEVLIELTRFNFVLAVLTIRHRSYS